MLRVVPEKNRLVVEGVNIIKRHTKANPQRNIKGGLVEREAPLHASNVQLRVPRVRQADAARQENPRRRPQGAHLPEVRGSGRQMSRLKERYEKEVAPALKKEFGYANVMAIPKIEKIVVNMGLGEATQNAKIVDTGADEIGKITGQKPVVTRAKKSIAQFKVRKGMPIGTMVTLRGERMWDFLDRLISVALPRVRDFRGVSPRGFDGRGNYTLGLKDQLLFPEIDYMKVDKARGMNISVVTTAKSDEESRKLLQLLGMPFRTHSRETYRTSNEHGHDCERSQRSKNAEVQDPAAQPLQPVRPSPRLHAQVRALPPLLPQAGARGGHRGGDEE